MLPASDVSSGQNVNDGTQEPSVTRKSLTKSLRQSKFAKRLTQGVLSLALLVGGTTGCTTFHNGFEAITNNGAWNETVVVLRNRSFSKKAWHRRKNSFCREKYMNDFCAGFRAGYEEVAQGSDGCTPAFPPQEYWSWEFQSAEGQARTAAWFAGYPHGCRAAEEDGVSNWSQIQMSAGLQAEYQQAGMLEHQGALYPIPTDNQISYPVEGMPYVPDGLPEGAVLVPSVNPPMIPVPDQTIVPGVN